MFTPFTIRSLNTPRTSINYVPKLSSVSLVLFRKDSFSIIVSRRKREKLEKGRGKEEGRNRKGEKGRVERRKEKGGRVR